MKRVWFAILAVALLVPGLALAQEEAPKIEITFWHAMGGWRVPLIERMVEDFNLQYPWIHVTVEYKGSYTDTLNAAIAAARAGAGPLH